MYQAIRIDKQNNYHKRQERLTKAGRNNCLFVKIDDTGKKVYSCSDASDYDFIYKFHSHWNNFSKKRKRSANKRIRQLCKVPVTADFEEFDLSINDTTAKRISY